MLHLSIFLSITLLLLYNYSLELDIKPFGPLACHRLIIHGTDANALPPMSVTQCTEPWVLSRPAQFNFDVQKRNITDHPATSVICSLGCNALQEFGLNINQNLRGRYGSIRSKSAQGNAISELNLILVPSKPCTCRGPSRSSRHGLLRSSQRLASLVTTTRFT